MIYQIIPKLKSSRANGSPSRLYRPWTGIKSRATISHVTTSSTGVCTLALVAYPQTTQRPGSDLTGSSYQRKPTSTMPTRCTGRYLMLALLFRENGKHNEGRAALKRGIDTIDQYSKDRSRAGAVKQLQDFDRNWEFAFSARVQALLGADAKPRLAPEQRHKDLPGSERGGLINWFREQISSRTTKAKKLKRPTGPQRP